MKHLGQLIRRACAKVLGFIEPQLRQLRVADLHPIISQMSDTKRGKHVAIYEPYHIDDSSIGAYTYIAMNSYISKTDIGKFCSIGPNLVCGWGVHPTNGVSTAPMFFSTVKQNGMTLCRADKVEERLRIVIGHDVFIGMNVTILDGVAIGNGAIIGAGAVVSKDIPPYAIAVGSPIKVIKYRFPPETIAELQEIKWWDFSDDQLQLVEQNIFDLDGFLLACRKMAR